ncbi:unnamed protein product [Ilex paraguariensis]|uniref:Uncharacterized protein n=1 Tax=Ilex paraguariensis TaxID=185542 RepID=A0ABC8U0K5_9AQUA
MLCKNLRTQYHIKDLSLIISFLFFLYLLLHLHLHLPSSTLPSFHTNTTLSSNSSNTTTTPTTLRHILFSIASSSDTFPKRNDYIRLWYKHNSTRAYLFLDRPTPISSLSTTTTLPPTLIYGNTSKFPYNFQWGHRYAIRIARIVKQAVEQNDSAIRWFVFGDDDTVFFTVNLIQTLAKYDHDRWFYVGANSERYELNEYFSFEMGFGGAGFAISHSLARVLARVLDSCLMRYPHLYGSDARVFSCLAELGVELTHESGFHQVK